MSFVPVTGPATFRAGDPPREGVVEFTDERRTVTLPIRTAIRADGAHARDDVHPSVGLLSGRPCWPAAGGGRQVRAGRWRDELAGRRRSTPTTTTGCGCWPGARRGRRRRRRPADGPRGPRRRRRRHAPQCPSAPVARDGAGAASRRVQAAPGRRMAAAPTNAPSWCGSRCASRPTRRSWSPAPCGSCCRSTTSGTPCTCATPRCSGPRRVLRRATVSATGPAPTRRSRCGRRPRRGRSSTGCWSSRVPDQIALDSDELVSLLEHGVGGPARARRRRPVAAQPRARPQRHDRPRPAARRRASAPDDGDVRTDTLFAFHWQLALHGDPLTQEEMDHLAGAAAPILRLRGSWAVVDPSVARKARKRLVRTVKPGPALAAALTGVGPGRSADGDAGEVVRSGPRLAAEGPRATRVGRRPASRSPSPAGLRATLRDYQLHGLRWLAELRPSASAGASPTTWASARPSCSSPCTCTASTPGRDRPDAGRLPGVGARQLGARDPPLRPGRARPPLPRRPAHPRRRSRPTGFVLTTYGTMRRDARGAGRGRAGAWSSPTRRRTSRTPAPRPPGRCGRSRAGARLALTGTPVENNLTELWSILDWTTPGLLGTAARSARCGPRRSSPAGPEQGARTSPS